MTKKDLLTEMLHGLMERKVSSYSVTVPRGYNSKMLREICDIIKKKKQIDIQIFQTALKEYVLKKNKNLHNLMKYAKQLNLPIISSRIASSLEFIVSFLLTQQNQDDYTAKKVLPSLHCAKLICVIA